jgi:hypothetical protein
MVVGAASAPERTPTMRLPLALLCLSLAGCPRGAFPDTPVIPAEIARGYLAYDLGGEAGASRALLQTPAAASVGAGVGSRCDVATPPRAAP